MGLLVKWAVSQGRSRRGTRRLVCLGSWVRVGEGRGTLRGMKALVLSFKSLFFLSANKTADLVCNPCDRPGSLLRKKGQA